MRAFYNHEELSSLGSHWSRANELRDILGDDKGFKPILSLWRKIEAVQQGYSPRRDDDKARLPLDQSLKELATEFKTAVNAYRVAAFTQRMPSHREALKAQARELDARILEALNTAWAALEERKQVGADIKTASGVWLAISDECAGEEGVFSVAEDNGLPKFVRDSRVNLWDAYAQRFRANQVLRGDVDAFTNSRGR